MKVQIDLVKLKKYLVVACKNFKTDIDDRFYSFLEISNNFNPDYEENQNLDLDYTIDRKKIMALFLVKNL